MARVFVILQACFNAPRAFDGYSNARSRVQGRNIDWGGGGAVYPRNQRREAAFI